MKKVITMIKALDHFTSESAKIKRCFIYRSGEILEENNEYLRIRTSYYTFVPDDGDGSDDRVDIHNILKSEIKQRVDTEIEWEDIE